MNNLSKIIFLFLFSTTVFAQEDLCKKTAGVERGGFTFAGPSTVCIGQGVDLRDNSGGTGVRYIFGYTPGTNISITPSQTNTNYTFLAAGTYTVLQYGKKGGKDMYYCDVVYVRDNNKPDISYEACNNTQITLTIRNSPINNFDSYRIRWSDGSTDNIPTGTVLPYSVKKIFSPSATQNILVEGLYSLPNNCPAPQPITVKMDRGEMFPRISKLELSEDGKEAIMTLIGNPDAEYFLSSRSIDQNGVVPNNTMPKIKAGSTKVQIPNSQKSQCFSVGRVGQGGCYEFSNEICTIPFTLKPTDENYELTWTQSPTGRTQNTGVFTFINQVDTQIIREENGTNKTTFNNVNGPYLDNTADCSKRYCYTLLSKVTVSYAGYTGASYIETATVSQKQCIDRKEVRPPAITDGLVSVNPANNVEFTFIDNSSWNLDRKLYRFYRLEGPLQKKIDSTNTIRPFLDTGINASEKSYCYKVSFVDKCGSESDLSPSFCSIFLNENAIRNLEWSSASPFGNTSIRQFEVLSYNEQSNATTIEATKTPSETTFTPILDKFEEEAKFQIRTTSTDGKESFSNIYVIPIAVKLFLPEAFSPNNDNINESFEIKGLIKRIAKFEIQIYNRWGNPIFISNDININWDGTFQNTLMPSDTYTYKIYVKSNDGKEFNKSGKFLLLR
ncbi:MAG: T9SS type B sorting domain-containing protein [Emticicia sp.]|uniref:T9SS type B sorting domain-containing protein n=1 Tax=Emticicia sp. TaxID=1930953 RepID=UPI003BA5FC3A